MKNICIIGGGISGLASAKAFIEQGFRVTVFEKASALGGVWRQDSSYVGISTQTTKNEYAFSDFPMPEDYPEWPSGDQVRVYLEKYAAHFQVLPHMRFHTEVLNMQQEGSKWTMELLDRDKNEYFTMRADFVVVCSGVFHEKYIPDYPGMQEYKEAGGSVLHSSELKNISLLKNKHVAVVGFAKSATDIATQAADHSFSTTLLYRKAQWKVPRFFANKVNLKYLLFSRFTEAFFLPYRKTGVQQLLHSIGKPLVWTQWRAIEMLIKAQFKLKQCGMIPRHKIENQVSCSLGVAPVGFYEKVREKKIRAINTEIAAFKSRSVLLKNGQSIQPDLLVFGTGFKQTLPFLSENDQGLLRDKDGMYCLHRNILNPGLPNLAFVGFNSSLFSTLTSEVAANWVVNYVMGNIQLPTFNEIMEEVTLIAQWRRKVRPIAAEFSGLCVAPFNFQHLDLLMKDMRLKTRGSKNPFYEFFKPISPGDYHKLLKRPAYKEQATRVQESN